MKHLSFFISFLFIGLSVLAQSAAFKGFQLADNPVVHNLESKYKSESVVIVYDGKKLELVSEGKDIEFYMSYHKIIRVNDEKGIEAFNKIYIPVNTSSQLVYLKARSVSPSGKIMEIKPDAIKDYTDDENDTYKIFAIDGLISGSEVEFTYTLKKQAFFFGTEVFQYKFPVKDAYFEIRTPGGIKYEAKAYNSSVQPKDTLDEEQWIRTIRYIANDIPSYSDEKYAMVAPSLQQVQYKISYTANKGFNVRLFTWNELAESVYTSYNEFSKSERDVVSSFVKKIDIKETESEVDKIRKVEHYIKTNIKSDDNLKDEEFDNFSKIIKTKIATTRGINRLLCAVLQKLDIAYVVVLAADREHFRIEKNFENWNYADNVVIYFPGLKKCIAPSSILYRYPFIPSAWTGTNALFCTPFEVNGVKSAIGEVKVLPMEPASSTLHNLESKLYFNKGLDTVFVEAKNIHTGYSAPFYKVPLLFWPPDDQTSFFKETARNTAKTETILSKRFINTELNDTEIDKPFVMEMKLASVDLLESAGNKILLKIGECIGPQVEMYNERTRLFDVEIDYPHFLDREITLKIPEGYRVKNADDLNFNVSISSNNKITACFISKYKLIGNELVITISEQYNIIKWPKSEYDNFIKVINASADFNKVVLVLEKEK